MARIIGILDGKYFEWSTIVDAPTMYDADILELMEYIKEEYGNEGCAEMSRRLKAVEDTGVSSPYPQHRDIPQRMREWLKESAE